MQRLMTAALYLTSSVIGVLAFAAPFLLPQLTAGGDGVTNARQPEAPLVTAVLILLCLVTLLLEVQGQGISAKTVAALGILISVTAILRFLETAVPGFGGFSPIFAPIILAGYVFGARFGFLMGALTLLVSALITGGIGPWLPYQMFAAAWVGLTAGWLPHPASPKVTLGLLALFSFIWGMLFGFLINIYFWPFVVGDPAASWHAGLSLAESVGRYLAFYAASSFAWDVIRALGNVALILILGLPTLRALSRFRDRLQFEVTAP